MAVGLAIVLCIAVVIGTGIILSVRNVNVSFADYSGLYTEEYEEVRTNLDKIKGSGLLFVKEEDVTGKVTHPEHIAVVSYEKVFPCTINVTLKERVEKYTVRSLNGYLVYDSGGKLVRTVNSDNQPMNPIDGCPNVELYAKDDQIESIAVLGGYFEKKFGPIRRTVASIAVRKYLDLEITEFTLKSGMTLSVSSWGQASEQKIVKAYEVYETLSDVQRCGGSITVIDGNGDGEPIARYSA